MCYMSETEARHRVGVRELRQNLSIYLRRVKAGETLEVTERGATVAELGPARVKPASVVERLIAEGRITPARRSHGALPPPSLPAGPGPTLTEILFQMREEDTR